MKTFHTLEEFLHSDEFSRKDLSDCDLSNLDLSDFSPSIWVGFKFYKTDFTNTNIKFYPHKLCFYSLKYCNFTNCDLSYLTAEDLKWFSIEGSNFTNTNFHVNNLDSIFDFYGVTFGNAYHGNELDMYASKMDIDTLLLNPNLSFSSTGILEMLGNSYFSCSVTKINVAEVLDIDKKNEGELWKFWNILSTSANFSNEEKLNMLSREIIQNKDFNTLNLSELDYDFLSNFIFYNCTFQKIIFPNHNIEVNNIHFIKDSKAEKVIFPTITPSSWNEVDKTRLFANVTFFKNLYVELGRFCNGKCKFCRNKFLEPCKYDFETIYYNLHNIYSYLNNIVIGGGEPTLLTEDLKKLCHSDMRGKITIFTNASLNYDKLMELNEMVPLDISRHSIDDDENNKILGVEALTNVNLRFLCASSLKPITLCATCFENGLDSKDKILDYIKYYSKEVKIHNFLFQTLHQDLNTPFISNTVLPINNQVFDLVINKLKENDFEISMPIYSTGDYKLIIAKKEGIHISFKQYITKEEIESKWYQSPKRTFDLSMDPSGNLYENWHQSSGKVLIKKLR